MIIRAVVLSLLLVPTLAYAKDMRPFGSQWRDRVYSSTTPWISVGASAGLSFNELDNDVSTASVGVGPAFGLRGIFHLDHRLSFPLDLEFRSFDASADILGAGWQAYRQGSVLFGSGVRFSPWLSDRWDVTLSGRFGLHSGTFEAWDRAGTRWEWGGSELYLGGGVEVVFYPIQPLGIGLFFIADSLMGSEEHPEQKLDWQIGETPQGARMSGSMTARASWNF